MDFIKELIANPEMIVLYATAFVGAAAALARAIEIVTGITASKKDDVYAGKITKAVAKLKSLLDTFGLKPKP